MSNGNPVGSLTETQKSIIVGCLLGDGYMRCKTNAHLQITHSLKQKNLVDWKYRNLKDLVRTPPSYYFNNGRHCYRFFTRSLPCLTYFYRKFYKNRVKIIPKKLDITPLSLTVWFMDDGSKSYNTVYLNTQQFDKRSQENLRSILLNKWEIKTTFNKDKEYLRIRIKVESIKRFLDLVDLFILPTLRYKLPL